MHALYYFGLSNPINAGIMINKMVFFKKAGQGLPAFLFSDNCRLLSEIEEDHSNRGYRLVGVLFKIWQEGKFFPKKEDSFPKSSVGIF